MNNTVPKMLVIAPHPDDSILGAGGTMARFVKAGGEVTVFTIAAHKPPLFSKETFHLSIEEAQHAFSLIGVKEAIFLNKAALSLAQISHDRLNKAILDVLMQVCPNVFLTPYIDRNIDHRVVFESAMVASRPFGPGKDVSLVAAYEVLSSTHWTAPQIESNFIPNWVVDITEFIDIKLDMWKGCKSQFGPVPHPRSPEALEALALFRGSQMGMSYGEAFRIIRTSVSPEIIV